ncbi:MAG: hypothetical protein OYH76_03280 [Defluviicoccus sp.]|nr:hypothetical protein [Defluviicoccus sp.]MDE0274893.1 hypothetical protein [Defluviicoccus sp.]
MKSEGRDTMPKARSTGGQKPPSKHQPTKAEMEEVIVIDASLDELAGAVLAGGALRREQKDAQPAEA